MIAKVEYDLTDWDKQDSPMLIWAITDNKPGHRNQLEGLINALSEMRPTEVKWINAGGYLQGFANILHCKKLTTLKKSPQMILGAGHQTHAQLLAYKYCLQKPVVVLMKPSLPLSWFDLCFIPRHDQPPGKDNVVATLGPINKVRPATQQNAQQGLFLIGGHSPHFNWDTAGVIQQIRQLITLASPIQWQVALSRRTPDNFIDELTQALPDLKIVKPDEVDKAWLPRQMQRCGIIWVTADSMSMLYEAITSSARVGIIKLPAKRQNRIKREIQRLLADRIVSEVENSAVLRTNTASINEAQRCAAVLLEKLKL